MHSRCGTRGVSAHESRAPRRSSACLRFSWKSVTFLLYLFSALLCALGWRLVVIEPTFHAAPVYVLAAASGVIIYALFMLPRAALRTACFITVAAALSILLALSCRQHFDLQRWTPEQWLLMFAVVTMLHFITLHGCHKLYTLACSLCQAVCD